MNTHSTTSNEGWIEWNGGECPVAASDKVEVRCKPDGWRAEGKARTFEWRHGGGGRPTGWFDIIAYRIVERAK